MDTITTKSQCYNFHVGKICAISDSVCKKSSTDVGAAADPTP